MTIVRPIFWKIPVIDQKEVSLLADKVQQLDQRLREIVQTHQQVRFAHSLAVEDTVIMDRIARLQLSVGVFTLDTGLLNTETYELLQRLAQRYPQLPMEHYFPDADAIANYVQSYGKTAFYDSVERRKQCCFLRKVAPLNKALAQADAWLTGQRQSQSVTRQGLAFSEWDDDRQMDKYNPIFDWSEQEVWAYILQFDLPFNELYHQGYPSIGCEPCTRPVKQGENIRAGRWWWESQESKECGLHHATTTSTRS